MALLFLLIDDDADDRELFAEALETVDPGIACSFSENAEEALVKLGTGTIARPNLIFLDINLPGMNGWECLKKLKENDQYRNIPVIIYSTSSHKRDKQEAEMSGALCLITKPADFRRLIKVLTEVVTHVKNNTYSSIGGSVNFN